MRALIVDDDPHIRDGLKELLEAEGFEIVTAGEGASAMDLFLRERLDFVVLDIMMPGQNGYELCRQIREHNTEIPVIFLSQKNEEIDRVIGLELGADDFISKPYGMREVVARIRAVSRRYFKSRMGDDEMPGILRFGDLEVYPAELRARRGDDYMDLTARDVKILKLLHRNQGKVVSRDELFNECWGRNYLPSSRTLDQHISQLRKVVEVNPRRPKIIRTVHGVGYRYDGPAYGTA